MSILLILVCYAGQGQTPQACIEGIKQSRKEELTSLRIGEVMMKLSSENFKAAVVVFYKTDCPFCEKLMPELKKLQVAYASQDFEVYAICLNSNTEDWKQYINDNHYEGFRNYCDGLSYAGKIAESYHVFATPTLFLINGNWQIAAKPKGIMELKDTIASML